MGHQKLLLVARRVEPAGIQHPSHRSQGGACRHPAPRVEPAGIPHPSPCSKGGASKHPEPFRNRAFSSTRLQRSGRVEGIAPRAIAPGAIAPRQWPQGIAPGEPNCRHIFTELSPHSPTRQLRSGDPISLAQGEMGPQKLLLVGGARRHPSPFSSLAGWGPQASSTLLESCILFD